MPEEQPSTELATTESADQLRELASIIPDRKEVIQAVRIAIPALIVATGGQELIPDLGKRGKDAIEACFEFTQPPTSIEEQNEILAVQREAQKLRTTVIKQADAYKAQLNGPKEQIHEIAKAAEAALKKAEAHLQGLVNNYQQKLADERRKQEQEAQRQRDEITRKEREAQQQREQAERDRQAAILAQQRAEQAKTDAARRKAEQEAEELRQKAIALDTAAHKTELAVESAPEIPAVTAAPAAKEIKGFTLNGRNDHEKGENLKKLFAKHPEFFACHIKEDGAREFSIKLKIKDITDAINGVAPFAELTGAPGITITTKLSTLR